MNLKLDGGDPSIDANETEAATDANAMLRTIKRLRNRAWLLRAQAYIGLGLIVALAITLISVFSVNHIDKYDGFINKEKSRNPYDYQLMENRHNNLSEKITELTEAITTVKQDLFSNKISNTTKTLNTSIDILEGRSNELKKIKLEIEERLTKDRANLTLEINRLREERDAAVRDGSERRIMWILLGEVSFRLGALVLAIYLSSVVFNVTKYLLRVADHLNSTADSIDLLRISNLSIERGIEALTPHAIDFHIDDALSMKLFKDLAGVFAKVSKADKTST
jgi:hypothetical protein